MGRCVRGIRGLGIAALFLVGAAVCLFAASIGTADFARAQTACHTVVEANKRVEPETIRSYFQAGGGPNDRLDAARIDAGLKALYQTGLFQGVKIKQQGGRGLVTVIGDR